MKPQVKMKSLLLLENKERFKIHKEWLNYFNILIMKKNVDLYKNDIWLPSSDIILDKVNENTCFDILESPEEVTNFVRHKMQFDKFGDEPIIKAKKIILKLKRNQQIIITNWMDAYASMYNCTLKYIKNHFKTQFNINKNNFSLNWMKIRKNLLDKRNEIIDKSGSTKSNQIKVHDIDYSIKLACQNYKTLLTLYNMKIIKHFRIRYWKKNKKNKILDLEKNDFLSGSIRKNVLGEVEGYYNGKKYDFSKIKKDSRIIYKNNCYYLYVPEEIEEEEIDNRKKIISLDPGLRTFMTGITENKVVEIGNNINKTMDKYIKRKEEIQNKKEIPKKIRSKIIKNCNKKINNVMDEIHWKSINYLTLNYSKILIGNMSTKRIINNENNLSPNMKKIANIIKLYEYRNRLKYKCNSRGVKFKCVDEKYTSKMCGMCGNIKEDLGSSKIYSCDQCGMKIGRDINGSRMIYIKSIYK